jgi:hypothetical protein
MRRKPPASVAPRYLYGFRIPYVTRHRQAFHGGTRAPFREAGRQDAGERIGHDEHPVGGTDPQFTLEASKPAEETP